MSHNTKQKNSLTSNHYTLSSKPKDSSLLRKQNIVISTSLAQKLNTNITSNDQLVNKSTNSFRQQGLMNKFKTTKNSPDKKIDRNFSNEKGKVLIQNNAVIQSQNIITNYEKYNQNASSNQTFTTNSSIQNSNFTCSNNTNSAELDMLKKKLFKKTDKNKTNPLNFTNSNKTNITCHKIQLNESNYKLNSTTFAMSNVQKSIDVKKDTNMTSIKHQRTPSKHETENKLVEKNEHKLKFNNIPTTNKVSPRLEAHPFDVKLKNEILLKPPGKTVISTPKNGVNNLTIKHELIKQQSSSKLKSGTTNNSNYHSQQASFNIKDTPGNNLKNKHLIVGGNSYVNTDSSVPPVIQTTNPINLSRKNSNEKRINFAHFNKHTPTSKNNNNTTNNNINNSKLIVTQEGDKKKYPVEDKSKRMTPKKSTNTINTNLNTSVNPQNTNTKLNISSLIKTKMTQQSTNINQGPLSSVPMTKYHSKTNSKSSSRIEDKSEPNKKIESEVKKMDINLVGKQSQTKTSSLQSTINNSKNNSTNQFKKHLTTTNSPKNTLNINFNKELVKKNINNNIVGKPSKQVLSLKLNLNSLNQKEVTLKEKNLLKDKNNNISDLNQNNLSIDNILDTSNCSVKSSLRESNYYKRESEKISNYIKIYYNKNAEYPPTNLKHYKYGRLIGKGAFGKVNLGLHTLTGRRVAIKSFNKKHLTNENAKKKIYYETNLMKNLKHNSIVRIYEMFETSKYIMIIMEYVSCGDLLSFVRKRSKLSETIAKLIFRQIIEALQYIQSQNIVHRDIKLDNILIDLNNNIKLCDFGVSKQIKRGELMKDQCGTPAYISPEILNNQGYEGFSVDIWSSGVVLYAMLSGTVPFKANNMSDLHKLILKGNPAKIKEISEEANNLINGLLEIDPKKRLTVDQILSHPWLKNSNDNNGKIKSKMNLFTNAERILLSKSNVDFRTANKEDLIENFTLRNLDTLQEVEQQNVHTKSVILAPFSSSIKNEELDEKFFLVSELRVENEVVKFIGKAKEANRNYELNNNGEIDNGILINPDPEEKKSIKEDSPLLSPNSNSLKENNVKSPNSQNEVNNDNLINNRLLSEVPSPGNNSNRNNRKFRENNNSISNASTLILDENCIKLMEELGYKREILMKMLYANDHNYATTAYYLLLNSKLDVA